MPTDAKHLLQAALELLGPNSSAVSFGAALGAFEPGSAAATAEMHWRFQIGYIHKPSEPHGLTARDFSLQLPAGKLT